MVHLDNLVTSFYEVWHAEYDDFHIQHAKLHKKLVNMLNVYTEVSKFNWISLQFHCKFLWSIFFVYHYKKYKNICWQLLQAITELQKKHYKIKWNRFLLHCITVLSWCVLGSSATRCALYYLQSLPIMLWVLWVLTFQQVRELF